jgi:heme-degrading monooxygenase HmoA
MQKNSTHQSAIYRIELPAQPQAVVFVNGIVARDRSGFFWLWKNLNGIRMETVRASGCLQVKSGICSAQEVIMVSYWESEAALMDFFRGAAHRDMVKFTQRRPSSLCLYNEIYHPAKSGKYSHEPQGMALVYGG